MSPRDIIIVVDSTVAETEEAHRTAFNQAVFAKAGRALFWTPDIFPRLRKAMGGRERVRPYLKSVGVPAPSQAIARAS